MTFKNNQIAYAVCRPAYMLTNNIQITYLYLLLGFLIGSQNKIYCCEYTFRLYLHNNIIYLSDNEGQARSSTTNEALVYFVIQNKRFFNLIQVFNKQYSFFTLKWNKIMNLQENPGKIKINCTTKNKITNMEKFLKRNKIKTFSSTAHFLNKIKKLNEVTTNETFHF